MSSFSSSSENLQLCTEVLGFESSDDIKYAKDHWKNHDKEKISRAKYPSSDSLLSTEKNQYMGHDKEKMSIAKCTSSSDSLLGTKENHSFWEILQLDTEGLEFQSSNVANNVKDEKISRAKYSSSDSLLGTKKNPYMSYGKEQMSVVKYSSSSSSDSLLGTKKNPCFKEIVQLYTEGIGFGSSGVIKDVKDDWKNHEKEKISSSPYSLFSLQHCTEGPGFESSDHI